MKINLMRTWLNFSRAQYAIAKDELSAANRNKTDRGPALRACNHWRNETLTTAIQLRARLMGRVR